MSNKLVWELVDDESKGLGTDITHEIDTWRAKVPGGWLVTVWGKRLGQAAKGPSVRGGTNWGGGVTFVPDPTYGWELSRQGAEP